MTREQIFIEALAKIIDQTPVYEPERRVYPNDHQIEDFGYKLARFHTAEIARNALKRIDNNDNSTN